MTTITPEPARHGPLGYPSDHYLYHTHGFRSWALTLDHKRSGVM